MDNNNIPLRYAMPKLFAAATVSDLTQFLKLFVTAISFLFHELFMSFQRAK